MQTLNQTVNKLNQILNIKNLETERLYWEGKDTGKFVIKDDNQNLYGVVGKNYRPVTYAQLYDRVMEFLPEGKVVSCATGGFNRIGKAVINIKLPQLFDVNGEQIDTYINILNSLDGTTKQTIVVSPLRNACMNMFVLANKRNNKAFIRISEKHTTNGIINMNRDIKLVEQIYNAVQGQIEIARQLMDNKITTSKGIEFLNNIVEKKYIHLPEKTIEEAKQIWENPSRKEDEDRSLWTLFNSITEPLSQNLREKERINTFNQIVNTSEYFANLVNV